jgi:two-component system sensor histidine kinase UhpB
MSLRALINRRIAFSVFVIMLISIVITIWQAKHAVEKEVNSSFNLALQMIDLGFSHISRVPLTEVEWLRQISAIQQTRHIHLVVLNDSGEEAEWLDSESQIEDERKKPPEWFIRAVSTEYPSADYAIKLVDGRTKQIIVRADPIDEILEAWGESQAYFWTTVMMVVVIFIGVNAIFTSMLRTVRTIVVGLRRVESGHYGQKLPNFSISEFDEIATEVNHLSDALRVAKENNQALARHTMHIQESERRNLSRELHDEMGQSLTAIKAMAVTNRQATSDHTAVSDSIISVCNHLSGVVRSMMRTLHPLSLADLGLGATLTDLVNEWDRRHPSLKVRLNYDDRLENISHELAIHAYRIVQESLTNVVRHAQATEVAVEVLQEGEADKARVVITIKDNGQGGDAKGAGFGVLAMRERVENMGGKFKYDSVPTKGVTVKAWMPITEKNNNETA